MVGSARNSPSVNGSPSWAAAMPRARLSDVRRPSSCATSACASRQIRGRPGATVSAAVSAPPWRGGARRSSLARSRRATPICASTRPALSSSQLAAGARRMPACAACVRLAQAAAMTAALSSRRASRSLPSSSPRQGAEAMEAADAAADAAAAAAADWNSFSSFKTTLDGGVRTLAAGTFHHAKRSCSRVPCANVHTAELRPTRWEAYESTNATPPATVHA
jgi:hypothetical protein